MGLDLAGAALLVMLVVALVVFSRVTTTRVPKTPAAPSDGVMPTREGS